MPMRPLCRIGAGVSGSDGFAGGAHSVKHQFVPGYGESTAGEPVDVRQASPHFEHAAASVAMKMMMVRLPRTLVNRGASRKFDRSQPALIQERFDIPVNRGDAKAIHFRLRRFQHLERRKRPARAFESLANGGPLPRIALIFAGHHFNDSALSKSFAVGVPTAGPYRNGSNVCVSRSFGSGSRRPAALLRSAQSAMSRY